MADIVNWFEIPAADVERACAFYTAVLGASFQRHADYPDNAMFDNAGEGVSGEVCREEGLTPGTGGVRIYLNAPNGVADAVSKVEAAGGTVVKPKTAIGPHGYIAVIRDTEGNEVGIHNMTG